MIKDESTECDHLWEAQECYSMWLWFSCSKCGTWRHDAREWPDEINQTSKQLKGR